MASDNPQITAVSDHLSTYSTQDGGACQKMADLWCTYAATRALSWLNAQPCDVLSCRDFILNCQNADGGFAWQRGMRSDVWATYYCTQTLVHLGCDIPQKHQLKDWLASLLTMEGGFAMTPGQPPDIWATYYAVRTFYEILQQPLDSPVSVYHWLSATQQPSGGLGWNTQPCTADVRACYYGAVAWQTIGTTWADIPGWDQPALCGWVQNRQTPAGGFVFQETDLIPCLWATFRAVGALHALGSEPTNRTKCIEWILKRKKLGSGFTRWEEYPIVDVWACFSAIGALNMLGYQWPPTQRAEVVDFLHSCQLPGTGFTYREPGCAGDALATAALTISYQLTQGTTHESDPLQQGRIQWLQNAQMPFEDGVMYMPGRGAEIRCTLWTLSALRIAQQSQLNRQRLLKWFRETQNPDGGFGYWHGRGSDIVATVSALECLQLLGIPFDGIDYARVMQFLRDCATETGIKYSPGGDITLTTLCQGIRGFFLLQQFEDAHKYVPAIAAHASKIGGYAARPGGIPDLLSTYQAVYTQQTLGQPWDAHAIGRFLKKIRRSPEYCWTPLSWQNAGPLATCLGLLLEQAVSAAQRQSAVELLPLNL
jgi:prenyltransferase beta subunit